MNKNSIRILQFWPSFLRKKIREVKKIFLESRAPYYYGIDTQCSLLVSRDENIRASNTARYLPPTPTSPPP